MPMFWTPDKDEAPHGGPTLPRTVRDEMARWIDERAVRRAVIAVRGLVRRIASARTAAGRRAASAAVPPAVRQHRAS
ncbi:MAG: hypothetical protein JWL71_1193 [Acidobacteria bacterium]|nr:hypothetical protein [Acidobacteriota bacterium]